MFGLGINIKISPLHLPRFQLICFATFLIEIVLIIPKQLVFSIYPGFFGWFPGTKWHRIWSIKEIVTPVNSLGNNL